MRALPLLALWGFALGCKAAASAGPDPECTGECPVGTRKAEFQLSEINEHPGSLVVQTKSCDLACAPEQLCVPPDIPVVKSENGRAVFSCRVLEGFSQIPRDDQVDFSFGAEFRRGPAGPRTSFAWPYAVADLTAADLDGDGKDELVAARLNGPIALTAFSLGVGSATVTFSSTVTTIAGPVVYSASRVAAGDFDGDGHVDVAVAAGDGSRPTECGVWISRGDGARGFTDGEHVASACPQELRSLDVSGQPALVVAYGDPTPGLGLMRRTAGQLQLAPIVDMYFSSAILDDFDGDGAMDLFSTSPYTAAPTGLFFQRGGAFGGGGQITVGAQRMPVNFSSYFPVGDYDGDGKADLVALAPLVGGSSGRTVMRGAGDGNFLPEEVAFDTEGICRDSGELAADFDGDGVDEVVCLSSHFAERHYVASFRRPRGGAWSEGARTMLEAKPSKLLAGRFLEAGRLSLVVVAEEAHRAFVVEVP